MVSKQEPTADEKNPLVCEINKQELLDYVAFTRSTALYPKEVELAYLTLGLISELDEYLEVIGPNGDTAEEIKEAGDVMWYTARLADATGTIDKFVCMFMGAALLEDSYPAFPNVDGVAKLAGRVKKVLRGDDGAIEKIVPMMGDVYDNVIGWLMVRNFGKYLHNVLVTNQAKLVSRKETGKLKGDGNER